MSRRHRKTSVLIVDGTPRHTVDIVRSLGKAGYEVSILSNRQFPPARFSRYLDRFVAYDMRDKTSEVALDHLETLAKSGRYDVFIASGLDGFRMLSYGRERLANYVHLPVPTFAQFDLAEDKASITRYAEEVGVPVPESYYPGSLSDLEFCRGAQFPVIVKARRGQGHFAYAASYDELVHDTYPSICKQVPDQIERGLFPIVQELVHGKGHGFYALMNHGEVRGYFMHERIHEVPPSGGPSAMARSYYDEGLIEVGSRLLKALQWHGVAMVEFKKDETDGSYRLIEINPKFWGSLGLSIAAGVDFPRLLVEMALNGDVEAAYPPREPFSYQWISMDIAHSMAVGKPFLWLRSMLSGVPNDFRCADPLPSCALIGQGGMDVLLGKRVVRKRGHSPVGVERDVRV